MGVEMWISVFFFHEEDGIRIQVRVRGLGDVLRRKGGGRGKREWGGEKEKKEEEKRR